MFEGLDEVLEIGCGDAWPSRIVCQSVKNLTVSDFDPIFIEDAKSRHEDKWKMQYSVINLVEENTDKNMMEFFCVMYSSTYLQMTKINCRKILQNPLKENGSLLIGIPSLESQELINPEDRDPGHVNCKSGPDLKIETFRIF